VIYTYEASEWRQLPAYRPVAYTALWLQEQTTGLRFTPLFAASLGLVVACALALYALIYGLTRSWAAATLLTAAFAVDDRWFAVAVWIIERQSSLAALFGVLALLAVHRLAPRPDRRRLLLAGVFLLLLGAALSKEYGLAFAGAVPLFAFAQRLPWRPFVLVSALVAVTYGVLRFAVAGGAAGEYCNNMGYFRTLRADLCYSSLSGWEQLTQHAYNVGATVVGTFVPPLFDTYGVIDVSRPHVFAVPVGIALLAVVGAVKRPRLALPLLFLVVGNAALNFMVYRERNQIIGMVGLYGAATVGTAYLMGIAREVRAARIAAVVAFGLAVAWVPAKALKIHKREMAQHERRLDAFHPCKVYQLGPHVTRLDVVEEINRRAGRADPSCKLRYE
jgi:hypothetical protein